MTVSDGLHADTIFAWLAEDFVLPIIRTADVALAEAAVSWLAKAGMRTFEVAATMPGALELIRRLAEAGHGVGAGTIMDRRLAEDCIDAGAHFLVSPGIVPDMAAVCRERGVAIVLGALTPTEVLAALDLGAQAIKVFPVSSVGGFRHISALQSYFPSARFMPTGGVSIDDIPAYRIAGAAFLGIGGSFVAAAAYGEGDPLALRAHLKSMQPMV